MINNKYYAKAIVFKPNEGGGGLGTPPPPPRNSRTLAKTARISLIRILEDTVRFTAARQMCSGDEGR